MTNLAGSRGGNPGQETAKLEQEAKRLNLLPQAATLIYHGAGTDHHIEVYLGGRTVTLFSQNDFIPKFPPGTRKGEVTMVLSALAHAFSCIPAQQPRNPVSLKDS